MHFGFQTDDPVVGKAALLVYSIYRSRDVQRGPSGIEIWGQIERFARASAKRAANVGEYVDDFKLRMACRTINPKWMVTGALPAANEYGEITVYAQGREFMPDVMECPQEEQEQIVDVLYRQTSRVILLVRMRLEIEKPIEAKYAKEAEDE